MDTSLAVAAYSPQEISALTNDRVVEDHAGQAAFLYRMRERAVASPHYRLGQLAMLDGRVLAHLAGLRVAGPAGVEQARKKLADANRGTLFVFAFLAFADSDRSMMRDSLAIGLSEPALMDAVVAALAWTEFERIAEALRALARSNNPTLRRISIAAHAAHRIDPGELIARALVDSEALLRARAARAVGELGRTDLTDGLRLMLGDSDFRCRFWAGWSSSLLGNPEGPPVALEAGMCDPMFARSAIELAMRTGDPDWSREVIRALCNEPENRRQAVVAAGAFGDPAVLPWLLDVSA